MMAAMANQPFQDAGYPQVPVSHHEKDVPFHQSDISNNNLDDSEVTRENGISKMTCSSPGHPEVSENQPEVTALPVTDSAAESTDDQLTDYNCQPVLGADWSEDDSYEPGTAAWVKLTGWPWWPCRVIPKEECTVLLDLGRREPALACVHFLIENNYDVIYDKTKIRPWVDSVNQELFRKTIRRLKSKPDAQELFHKVLSMLETEYGVTVPTLPSESPKKPPRKKLVTDSTNTIDDKDPPTLSERPHKVGTPPKSKISKIPGVKRKKSQKVNGFDETATILDRPSKSTNITTECSERLSGHTQGADSGRTAGCGKRQRSVSTSLAKDSKKPGRRKRAKSSAEDSPDGRKNKSQKCLDQSFGTEPSAIRTLAWDHNIQEDSCDAGSLEPLPPSQPERAPYPEDDSMTEEDSDDDLPDVLSSTSKDPIQKGTLLWVKYYRFPFWPAIVRNCYCRKKTLKKLTVVFIGDGMNGPKGQPYSLPYNTKKVVMFATDTAMHRQFKEDGLKSPYAAQFKVSVDKVEDYLVKKCLQSVDSPFTFFAEDLVHGSGVSAIEEDDKMSQSSYSDVGEQDVKTEDDAFSQNIMSDSTDDYVDDQEDDSEEMSKKLMIIVEKRKERGARLLSIIKSDRMKNYLFEVYRGQQTSKRHKQYAEDETMRLNATPHDSGFGPIDDEEQQMEIVKVLAKYLQEAKGSSLPDLSYIFHVWLPEAIIWSLNRILKQTWENAEETYLKGPFRLKEEKQIEHRRMIESGKNIAPEDAERYRQKLNMVKEQLKSGSRT